MNLAKATDYDAIANAFKVNRKLFPHVRTDEINRMILSCKCAYDLGIIIMFNIYKRNNIIGDIQAPKGSCTIKHILNTQMGNGNAQLVLDKFLTFVNRDVYLSVRSDNLRAIRFYEKNNFLKVGSITWKKGTIPGYVYHWKCKNQELDFS